MRLPEGPGQVVFDVAYWIMPNLERLNIKAEAVNGLPVQGSFIILGVVYGLGYTIVVLTLACLAFQRKEFK